MDTKEKELREKVRLHPNALSHMRLGVYLEKIKHYVEAETEFMKAMRLNPDNSSNNDYWIHIASGNSFKELKCYDDAEEEYRKAIKINPNDAFAHICLDNLLYELEHSEKAKEDYKEYKEMIKKYKKMVREDLK
jgi:tetratricopeptide (TPR) repeat protein